MLKSDSRLLYEARSVRRWLVFAVILSALAGLALILSARFLSRIVNGVFLQGQSLDEVKTIILVMLGIHLLRVSLNSGSEIAAAHAAGRIKHALRHQVTTHLLKLGPAYTQQERTGELSSTILEGIETLDSYFRLYLPQIAKSTIIPITILFFVFPLDTTSGLVLLFTAPLIPLFMLLIGDTAERITRRQWASLSRMSAHFLDILQGLTTLKLFGRSREQSEAVKQASDQFRRLTMRVLRVTFLSALVLEWVATLSTAVVAVETGLRLLYGKLAFEQAFFVLLLAPEFYKPLRTLGLRFHAGMAGVAAAERIYEILETPVRIQAPPLSSTIRSSVSRFDVQFKEVHVAYDVGKRQALRGISFQISSGEHTALVGPSGSGKTTIAYLMLRFIQPDRGSITVNGHSIEALDPFDWRAQIAWVPQKPYLFNTTVAENLRLARPDANINQIIDAAKNAHAHDFIHALPQGYDTPIGERGARLSAGQAQRIALARAFLKDAPLIIFDEATSNLDVEHETRVRVAMETLLRGRTALLIAHRLSTIRDADTILVLSQGRILERGSHEALIQQGGVYQRMLHAYRGTA